MWKGQSKLDSLKGKHNTIAIDYCLHWGNIHNHKSHKIKNQNNCSSLVYKKTKCFDWDNIRCHKICSWKNYSKWSNLLDSVGKSSRQSHSDNIHPSKLNSWKNSCKNDTLKGKESNWHYPDNIHWSKLCSSYKLRKSNWSNWMSKSSTVLRIVHIQ